MGTCIYFPLMGTLDNQNALAKLRKWNLERDDSHTIYPHRVYRDDKDNIYHSVTHILKETVPEQQKQALDKWLERPTSIQERDVAAKRGTLMHNHAEYLLKTASKLARSAANRRNSWKTGNDGLERCPKAITKWALQKAAETSPRVPFSASGYARGLRSWILERVTAIHAVEFSIHKNNFAGTADALIDIDGKGPFICDWKSSQLARSDALLQNYADQAGAYSMGLRDLTGINCVGSFIVVARRSGAPQVKELSYLELKSSEVRFLTRSSVFEAKLKLTA